MRFAIAIPTDAQSWRLVRRAEELGFSRAWFFDTQMLSADPFVAMAAAAMKTTRILAELPDPPIGGPFQLCRLRRLLLAHIPSCLSRRVRIAPTQKGA